MKFGDDGFNSSHIILFGSTFIQFDLVNHLH